MKKAPTVKEIIGIIERIAPPALAVTGDPVGLQCGEPDRAVRCLMVALDATLKTVIQAARSKADLLVTHHPLLFEPLTPHNVLGPEGRALARAIQEGLPVYSAHTNLDASPQGINASLADLLDLRHRRFLQTGNQQSFKVVVFTPREELGRVKAAAFDAGAGRIGDYSGCSFAVEGTGSFHPHEGASPFIGEAGRDERVSEVRLEISVPPEALAKVLVGVRKVHPYEEPAIDVYPMVPDAKMAGLGIVGTLPGRSTVGQVAARIRPLLKAGSIRLVGKKGVRIGKVAVCAGSGASLLDTAVAAGAQLYITGDIKYHDARRAENSGIQLLDVGHFAPEKLGMQSFGKLLGSRLAERGLEVELLSAKEIDPFVTVS